MGRNSSDFGYQCLRKVKFSVISTEIIKEACRDMQVQGCTEAEDIE